VICTVFLAAFVKCFCQFSHFLSGRSFFNERPQDVNREAFPMDFDIAPFTLQDMATSLKSWLYLIGALVFLSLADFVSAVGGSQWCRRCQRFL
jgi:hypothetical protein